MKFNSIRKLKKKKERLKKRKEESKNRWSIFHNEKKKKNSIHRILMISLEIISGARQKVSDFTWGTEITETGIPENESSPG